MTDIKKSNFELVGEFHETFGHPKPLTLQTDILNSNPKLVTFRLNLISEEIGELRTAILEFNMTEVIDALGDILYVVYGMGQAFGIDLNLEFIIVHKSKMMDNYLVLNSKLSNFQLVGEFFKKKGLLIPTTIQKDIMKSHPVLVEDRLNLINWEFNKLQLAVMDLDMSTVINTIGYLLYAVYEMGHFFGIDLDQAFGIVHESNMSKICHNETEALETIQYYKTLEGFENVDVRYRLSNNGKYYVIYNHETGKILKSKFFKTPDFSQMMAN